MRWNQWITSLILIGAAGCLRVSTFTNADTGHSYITLLPENLPDDGIHSAAARVVVRQSDNAPVSGQQVQLRLDNVVVEQPAARTDAQGSVQTQLATTAAGEHSVTASLLVGGAVLPVSAGTPINVYTSPVPGGDAVSAGTSLNLLVVPLDAAGLADTRFTGRVQLSSSDAAATLPEATTFGPADAGLHVFRGIKFATPGVQTVSAHTDDGTVLRSASFTVYAAAAAPATRLALNIANNLVAGTLSNLLVFATDATGAATSSLAATVHFSSSDANALLPADYVFTADDRGQHTFEGVSLRSAGTQQISVSAETLTAATQSVQVAPGLPRYLQFAVQPSNTPACQPFSPNVQVQEYDAYGNAAVTFGDTVQLTLNSNAPDAALQGKVQARTVQGLATFYGLSVNLRGTFSLGADIGYEVTRSAPVSIAVETPVVDSAGPVKDWSGNIALPYVLRDACGTSVQLAVSFDPNNSGVFQPATIAPSDGNYLGVTNVPASATGQGGAYLWNSMRDLGSATLPAVRLRLVATVHGVDSAPTTTAPFAVNNGPSVGLRQDVSTGSTERCVVLADVNHDARPDLLTCDAMAHTVSVLLGDGNHTAALSHTLTLGAAPQALAAGALDSNASMDFVVAAGNRLFVYLGGGDGNFALAGNTTLPSNATALVLADINRDGLLDAASANVGGEVSVALGDGLGNLAAPVSTSLGMALSGLALADVNLDGKLDAVATDSGGQAVKVALGNGTGGFAAPQSYATGANTGPSGLALVDLDRNGQLDVLVALAASNQVAVFLGSAGALGAPTMHAACAQPSAVGSADFDSDGAADAVLACAGAGLVLLPGDGTGALGTAEAFSSGPGPAALAIGDFNRDHQPDVVTANLAGASLSLLFNDQSLAHNAHWSAPLVTKFQLSGNYATGSAGMGDLNGDSKVDVVVTLPQVPGMGIMLGDGAGQLGEGYLVTIVTPDPQALAVADLNNDGLADVITPSTSSNALIVSKAPVTYLPNHTAFFDSTQLLPVGQAPANVVAVDVNLDGYLDLVVPNNNSDTLSVVLNNTQGGFRPEIPYATGNGPTWVQAGDMNGDGLSDLVVTHGLDASLGVYLGHGNGLFDAPQLAPTVAQPARVSVGDINGDAKLDLVVVGNSATVGIFYGAGDGNVVAQAGKTIPGSQAIAAMLVDVRHNGSPYLVALNNQEPWQLLVYPNLGGGVWGPALSSVADYDPTTLALGDLNSDGYDDVVASSSENTVSQLLSDGRGGLLLNSPNGPTPEDQGGYFNGRLASGDLDHDGLLDVVEMSSTFIGVKRGQANAGFAALQKVTTFADDGGSHRVFVADLNRDGWLDIVGILNAGVVVLLNNKSGGMGTASTYGPSGNTQGALLDFNSDGKVDVLSGNNSALQLLLGDGAGAFTTSTAFSVPFTPHAVSMGDFDGDGGLDALVTRNGSLQLFLRRGNTYVAQPAIAGSCFYASVVGADLDRDGSLDAVVTCTSGPGVMTTYLGHGDGTFGPSTNITVFGAPDSIVAVKDVTLDGIPDIVWPISGGKGLALCVGDGSGAFGYPKYLGDDVHPTEVVLEDLNFDGLLDIYAYGRDWGVSLGQR